jgi:hypothetical protein
LITIVQALLPAGHLARFAVFGVGAADGVALGVGVVPA